MAGSFSSEEDEFLVRFSSAIESRVSFRSSDDYDGEESEGGINFDDFDEFASITAGVASNGVTPRNLTVSVDSDDGWVSDNEEDNDSGTAVTTIYSEYLKYFAIVCVW